MLALASLRWLGNPHESDGARQKQIVLGHGV
jgi:hypothetical protein